MVTSLSISMKDTEGKDLQKSITYVSASASSGDLAEMAQGLTALTSNTYVSADRVQKVNVDNETIPGGSKTEPTLSIGEWESASSIGEYATYQAQITYNGDGTLYAAGNCFTSVDMNSMFLEILPINEEVSGTLYASEGTNYAAKSITFSHG